MTDTFDQTKAIKLKEINDKLNVLLEYHKFNKLAFAFADNGVYSRDQYKKHLQFFEAGFKHRFRMLSGGNGTGKSYSVAYETALHVTGLYPDWWIGKRMPKINTVWLGAKSNALFRDSLQTVLLGRPGEEIGTGLIPKECIIEGSVSSIPGVTGGIGKFLVRHKNGQAVSVVLKTYDMHRENLQAATVDLVVLDEEPPEDVYEELVMRTRGTKTKSPGIVMLAFTPLDGLTNVILKYWPNGIIPTNGIVPENPSYFSVRVSWDDAPHLTAEDKEELLAAIAPNLRDARTKGIPALGSGRVYPVHEDSFVINYLKIGPHWPRAYGMDFGWGCTACIWAAKDPATGIYYIYSEHYQGKQLPLTHAYAIKQRGAWIHGICDPSGIKSSSRDGSQLIKEYKDLGLELHAGENAIAPGVSRILTLLETGQLKVVYNCEHWLNEFRTYRYDSRDANSIARNQEDHAMDATRYLFSKFDQYAISAEQVEKEIEQEHKRSNQHNSSDGRNPITGY